LADQLPFFSIVVPTRDRPGRLATCLASLAALNYPGDRFEVIVVDDGSRGSLACIVDEFRDRLDLTLLEQANAGPAAARNTGVRQSRGSHLAFTDDDCAPETSWLRAFATRFAAAPSHMVGGRTLNALPDMPYSAASQSIIDVVYAHYNADPDRPRFFASNNVAVPKALLLAAGGFDPAFHTAEDRELCHRWLSSGYGMSFEPDALVHHAHLLTLGSFSRQHFAYGRGAYQFHHLRAARESGRIQLEHGFYAKLLRHPLSVRPWRRRGVLASLLVLAMAANTAGFFWERAAQLVGDRDRVTKRSPAPRAHKNPAAYAICDKASKAASGSDRTHSPCE